MEKPIEQSFWYIHLTIKAIRQRKKKEIKIKDKIIIHLFVLFQMYIDPRNPRHAIQEAQHLISVSDTNLDGKLNLSEILSKMDLFLGSKMVDTERSFHDEF